MSRALKFSVGVVTVFGALVLFACSSGDYRFTDSPDNPYQLHNVQNLGCRNPDPNLRHPAVCFSKKWAEAIQPDAISTLPAGYGPSDLASAYNLPAGLTPTSTVAIVDAQDDPNAESDMAAYRKAYGLPPCTSSSGCFTKVNQNGNTGPLPSPDTGWAGEISLDLDMVSAICPTCKIVLVEADAADLTDLGTAVNTAASLGAVAISNSYGGSEDSSIASADASYFNHPGIFVTASAGDSDFGAAFPATSAHVTAVGGTALQKSSSSPRGWTETVWYTSPTEGTGSGCSAYIAKPSFQTDTGCKNRMEADVAAVADPNTGVAVYDTYGSSGWQVFGGTSAASPIVAAMFAYLGKASSADNSYSYAHPSFFYDVTSGSNGSCAAKYECTAQAGYDGPTGNGTPNGGLIYGGSSDAGGADSSKPDTGAPDTGAPDSGPKDAGAPDTGKDSGGGSTCSHSECATGKRLVNGCDSCASAVCAADPYCCGTFWDGICVSEVPTYCGVSCH